MERKNEAKRSLDFLRSSECYRNKILTDEKKREMSVFIKRTLCLKHQSLATPASEGISVYWSPERTESCGGQTKTAMLSTYAVLYRDG